MTCKLDEVRLENEPPVVIESMTSYSPAKRHMNTKQVVSKNNKRSPGKLSSGCKDIELNGENFVKAFMQSRSRSLSNGENQVKMLKMLLIF